MSCSFCLRAPQPCPVRQPSVHLPLRALPTAHTLLAPPYGSVAASRPVVSPLRLIQPIPSTRTKAENEEGRKRLRWGIEEEGESESELSGRRAKERETKNGKRKGGKRTGERGPPTRRGTMEERGNAGSCVSRAPRATHHILLSRLPTLTAGSVPDRRSRMPTTCAGREESHARHPAC